MPHTKKPLAAALGAAFLATAMAPIASAEANPFSVTQLSGGYDLVNFAEHGEGDESKDAEGKCGEGKCGEPEDADDGWTPLRYAARGGYSEAIRALLDAGANVNAKDNNGWTPLRYAAGGGHSEAIRALLDAGANVNAKDNDGWTPLHSAAGGGHSEATRALLDAGANVNAKINEGWTPLDMADYSMDATEGSIAPFQETIRVLQAAGGKRGSE